MPSLPARRSANRRAPRRHAAPRRAANRAVTTLLVATLGSLGASAAITPSTAVADATRTIACGQDGLVVHAPDAGGPSVLARVSFATGNPVLTRVGGLRDRVNAIGYSPVDGLIYGYTDDGRFVKFGENAGRGEVDLGAPVSASGVTWPDLDLTAGTVTADGVHLALTPYGGGLRLVRTDLSTVPPTSTPVEITGAVPDRPSDITYDPYTDRVYSLDGAHVYAIDPATGAGTVVADTARTSVPALPAAGAWTDSYGRVLFFQNSGAGRIAILDPRTGTLRDGGPARALSGFDATSCTAPALSESVSPARAGIGDTLTFSFTVANPGTTALRGLDFTDSLPADSGLAWLPDTVNPAAPGVGTVTMTSHTLRLADLTAPPARRGPLTFTAQARVVSAPSAGAGGYSNTSTLTLGDDTLVSDDPQQGSPDDPTRFEVFRVPTATDDAATTTAAAVRIPVLGNDMAHNATLDPASVRLLDADGGLVSTLVVPGQGRYRVDPVTGDVVFEPVDGFAGTATPVRYSVVDSLGDRSPPALITVTVSGAAAGPRLSADDADTPYGTPVRLMPLANDRAGASGSALDPATLRLLDSAGRPAAAVEVPGSGRFALDGAAVTFTPSAGAVGPASVGYRVADAAGTVATSRLTVAVGAPPSAVNDAATARHDQTVVVSVLANDTSAPGTTLDSGSVVLPLSGQPAGSSSADGGRSLTVPGQGRYTADARTGTVVFAPGPVFAGTTTPVTYRVADTNGATGVGTLRIAVAPGAVAGATPDALRTPFGATRTLDVLANDTAPGAAQLEPSTLVLSTDGLPGTARLASAGKTLSLAGVGHYVVNPAGTVTFTPESGFTGTAPAVRYRVNDAVGNVYSSLLSVATARDPNNPGVGQLPIGGTVEGSGGITVTGPTVNVPTSGPAPGVPGGSIGTTSRSGAGGTGTGTGTADPSTTDPSATDPGTTGTADGTVGTNSDGVTTVAGPTPAMTGVDSARLMLFGLALLALGAILQVTVSVRRSVPQYVGNHRVQR